MKPAAEWTEFDILNLPVGEHDWFEIKGSRAIDLTLPNVHEHSVASTLSPAVSAFANSGGGQIILGLKDQRDLAMPRCVDQGGVSLNVKRPNTKEWLDNFISTLVANPLRTFSVYVVTRQADDSQIESGKGLFVIDIGDSPDAPHQARDHCYYVRAASRTVPASHQLVVDISNRRKHPRFELKLFHRPMRAGSSGPARLGLGGTLRNTGTVMAQYVNLVIYIPEVLLDFRMTEYESLRQHVEVIDRVPYYPHVKANTNESFDGTQYRTATMYEPILPGRHLSFLVDVPLVRDYNNFVRRSELRVLYSVHADSAAPMSGEIPLGLIER